MGNDGVALTIGFETVIFPNQYFVFTDNLNQFQAQSTGNIFVGAQCSGGLKTAGETVTLLDANGAIVDQVSYTSIAPWTSDPVGSGLTLALVNPNLDNDLASTWVASSQINGTPGAANDSTVQTPTVTKIFAAGETGNEIISLRIAGVQVATFNLGAAGGAAGDIGNRNFIEFSYSGDLPFDASDVRVAFINDTYDPANGIDYNVAIDRIEIEGVDYQTEAPNVFSTGTYVDGIGFQDGFQLSETLHGNGYFQYAV